MPGRIIKDSFCRSDDVANMTWFEQTVFIRLITTADDFGRLDGRPAVIRCAIFPLELEKVSENDIKSAISSLCNLGVIVKYFVAKKPYIYIPSFEKYQKRRAKESKFPSPFSEESEQNAENILVTNTDSVQQFVDTLHTRVDNLQTYVPDNREPITENREPLNANREPLNANREPLNANREPLNANREPVTDEEKETVALNEEMRTVAEAWNASGLNEIKHISPKSARYKMLKARLAEYGLDGILEAIRRASHSQFLKGQNNHSWIMTFDWFIKPGNFPKVLEGNYDNRSPRASPGQEHSLDRLRRLHQEGKI